MTRAARRATTLLLAMVAVLALSLAVLAGPAFAADDGEDGTGGKSAAAAEEASGFGAGLWDGMVLAGVCGVLLGIGVFALSRPGEIDRVGHADHHTPSEPESLVGSMASASGTQRFEHGEHDGGDQQMAP